MAKKKPRAVTEETSEAVWAAKKAWKTVPTRFHNQISLDGVRKVAYLIAEKGVYLKDACLLAGYVPHVLQRHISPKEDPKNPKYAHIIRWAQAKFKELWLQRLANAYESDNRHAAEVPQKMLHATDERFRDDKRLATAGAVKVEVLFVGRRQEAGELPEMPVSVIEVGAPQLGDGA